MTITSALSGDPQVFGTRELAVGAGGQERGRLPPPRTRVACSGHPRAYCLPGSLPTTPTAAPRPTPRSGSRCRGRPAALVVSRAFSRRPRPGIPWLRKLCTRYSWFLLEMSSLCRSPEFGLRFGSPRSEGRGSDSPNLRAFSSPNQEPIRGSVADRDSCARFSFDKAISRALDPHGRLIECRLTPSGAERNTRCVARPEGPLYKQNAGIGSMASEVDNTTHGSLLLTQLQSQADSRPEQGTLKCLA
jgi:hypothetical protein